MKIKRKVDARISSYIGVDPKIIACVIENAVQEKLGKSSGD